MTRPCLLTLVAALVTFASLALASSPEARFRPLDVFIDSGSTPLAAYQVELKVKSGDAKIVGVEGGEHAAYKKPPYYDAKALMGGRIILAAFSTAGDLPTGRHRVLTVHVRESGPEPEYELVVHAAADAEARPLRVRASLAPRKEAD